MTCSNRSFAGIPCPPYSGMIHILVLCALTTLAGCQWQASPVPIAEAPPRKASNPSGPPTLPESPLAITTPVHPSTILDDKDISKFKPFLLSLMASRHAGANAYPKAAQCQFWVVQATKEGRYDLACWESLSDNIEAALYWLQEAGRLEGVNARWATLDPDLEKVRQDPRWQALLEYLCACEDYWRVAGPKKTVVIVPDGYDRQTELPVVVWLHGMGGNPSDLRSTFQTLANKHRLGVIGVSGTIPTGKTKFSWADVAEEDYERIRRALTEARKSIRWRQGTTVALGFSQGAMVGLEVAVRHPEEFAGAITISAGTGSPVQLDEVFTRTALAHQGFVIVCGGKEHPSSIERSEELVRWLKTEKARVLKPSYPNHAYHGFPTDFAQRLPTWLTFIERAHRGIVEESNVKR
jgi:predicted esterase